MAPRSRRFTSTCLAGIVSGGWATGARNARQKTDRLIRGSPDGSPIFASKTSSRSSARFLVVAALGFTLLGSASPALAGDEKPKPERKTPVNVAVLLFEGVELLDFAGPAEVFGVAGEGKSF